MRHVPARCSRCSALLPPRIGIEALKRLVPTTVTLPADTRLARVYYTNSAHPRAWNSFRHVGPCNARWDHHVADATGAAVEQKRGIYYATSDAKICLAEAFQDTRRIDRAYQAPWLVVFRYCRATPRPRSDQRFCDADGRIDGDPLGGSRARARMGTRSV